MTDLSDAFLDYQRATNRLKKALDDCAEDGWYFTRAEQEDVERAEANYLKELKKALGLETKDGAEGL